MESARLVLDIIARLWDPIARRVNYARKIGRNMDNLQNKVNELTRSKDDLQMEVRRATQEGMVPTNEVRGWLQSADEIIMDATEMQKEFGLNKKCFHGWCLDCPSRYKLGKRIVKATEVVHDLRAKNNFGEIAVLPLPESVPELPTTTIREQTSTAQAQEKVLNWLMDANTRKIGIWGMAGVGKTRLMKNINNLLRGTQHFDVVIFVTVSKDWNMKKLRHDIGKEIILNLSAEEDERRASRLLFMALKTKKFLLILDDVWDRVDLDELGVPTPEERSACKVALTTRDRAVCNVMETDEEIMVKVLPPEEAWELFQEKAGTVISPRLESTARQVCQECHGLPLAIIVVGRALRKENGIEVWEHAFRVLKDSQFELKGMEREVYLPLKFSYDRLETDTLRNCFLYCSLFPEDYAINIDRLIELWTMEGFIQAVESLQEASVKGHYLLKELTDSCLLEKDNILEETVKLHDVIRDMAIKITSESIEKGSRFLVRAGVGLKRCPEVEKWEGKDRISLMENNIGLLPDEPKSTKLSTLLLGGNDLQVIPQSFFNQMKNLCVLDLSGTMI